LTAPVEDSFDADDGKTFAACVNEPAAELSANAECLMTGTEFHCNAFTSINLAFRCFLLLLGCDSKAGIPAQFSPGLFNRHKSVVFSNVENAVLKPATLSTSPPIALSFPLGTIIQQPRRQLAPFSPWQRAAVRRQRLQANMVGASGVMRANPRHDGAYITPNDNGVYQPVTAAIYEIFIGKAESAQVGYVIGQVEIHGHIRTRDLSCFDGIGFKYNGLLNRQQPVRA
jgi:hypothetical protein